MEVGWERALWMGKWDTGGGKWTKGLVLEHCIPTLCNQFTVIKFFKNKIVRSRITELKMTSQGPFIYCQKYSIFVLEPHLCLGDHAVPGNELGLTHAKHKLQPSPQTYSFLSKASLGIIDITEFFHFKYAVQGYFSNSSKLCSMSASQINLFKQKWD